MKLINLLNELTAAAAEAQKKGLEPMSFGRYGTDGKVTHMVKGDKLIPVAKQKDAANDPQLKPTGTSAKAAGKAPSNAVTATDAAKTSGNELPADPEKENKKMDKQYGLSGAQDEPEHMARPNPHFIPTPEIGKKSTHEDVKKSITPTFDKQGFSDEIVIGEDIYLCNREELNSFLWGQDLWGGKDIEYKIAGVDAAINQDKQWRSDLPVVKQRELLQRQIKWQQMPPSQQKPEERESNNAFFNSLAKGPPPATVGVKHPIERGMAMGKDKLKDFLRVVRIGEEVDIPPSGFSTAPDQARAFGEPDETQAGVLMRISPTHDGNVHGIALHGFTPTDVFEDDEFNNMRPHEATELKKGYEEYVLGWQTEQEIIRPSGPKAIVRNVKKIMEQPDNESFKQARCLYIIDMEEMGYPVDTTVTEDIETDDKLRYKTFEDAMNTPLRQTPDSSTSLTNILESI